MTTLRRCWGFESALVLSWVLPTGSMLELEPRACTECFRPLTPSPRPDPTAIPEQDRSFFKKKNIGSQQYLYVRSTHVLTKLPVEAPFRMAPASPKWLPEEPLAPLSRRLASGGLGAEAFLRIMVFGSGRKPQDLLSSSRQLLAMSGGEARRGAQPGKMLLSRRERAPTLDSQLIPGPGTCCGDACAAFSGGGEAVALLSQRPRTTDA